MQTLLTIKINKINKNNTAPPGINRAKTSAQHDISNSIKHEQPAHEPKQQEQHKCKISKIDKKSSFNKYIFIDWELIKKEEKKITYSVFPSFYLYEDRQTKSYLKYV